MTERTFADLSELAYDDRGLIPAIAQDTDGRVLMLAWMNEETLRETLREGRMVYWSRSRQERWAKGDTSGDRQFEELVGIQRSHAAGASRGDCLSIDVIGDIARREHTRDAG